MSQAAYYNGYDDGFEDGKRAGLKEAGSASAPVQPEDSIGADGVSVPKGTSTTLSTFDGIEFSEEGLLDLSNVAAGDLCVRTEIGLGVFDESVKFQIKLPSYITSCILGITPIASMYITKWVVQDAPAGHAMDIPDSEGLVDAGAEIIVSRISDATAFVLVCRY